MEMAMPTGEPVRLTAQVAGSLSRMQGLMQQARPQVENAYAMHWLAMRQAGHHPAFQQMTQQMLWGLYGMTAMQGLMRHALSGRATPEVMGGIIDQARLIQRSFTEAAPLMEQFLGLPEVRQIPAVAAMAQAFVPLDRIYHQLMTPVQTVMTALPWAPGAAVPMASIPMALWGQMPTHPNPPHENPTHENPLHENPPHEG